jgi:hypothetical protein
MGKKPSRETARQTFRQFAWNLAGTLAAARGGKGVPAGQGGKR